MAYLSWTKFFWYKPLNNGNNESNDPELGCAILGPKMVHLPQKKNCGGELLISF